MPTMRHGENAFELAMMVRQGMRPMDAIRSSTSVAAQTLGLADQVGTLAPGRLADVLVVAGDPLEHIECLERDVRYVLKEGEVVVATPA
jgi:imidazolonepropionase-like amidohydrolase